MSVPLAGYLVVSAVLFGIGVFGILSLRSGLMVLMSAEIILNAAMLNTIAFWRFRAPNDYSGQMLALLILTVAAVEMSLGIAVMLMVYRRRSDQRVDQFTEMRG